MTRRTTHLRHHRRASTHPAHSRLPRRAVAMSGSASHWNAVSRSRARWFFSFLVFTTIAFLVTQAFAQAPAFKSEKLDPALTAKAAVTQMEQARKEGVSVPSLDGWAKMAAFEAYYKRYIPGKMKDEAYAGELGAITQSLLDDLDRATKGKYPAAPLIHKYIIDIAKSISLDFRFAIDGTGQSFCQVTNELCEFFRKRLFGQLNRFREF